MVLLMERRLIVCRECGYEFGEDEAELCRACREHICPKCKTCGCPSKYQGYKSYRSEVK